MIKWDYNNSKEYLKTRGYTLIDDLDDFQGINKKKYTLIDNDGYKYYCKLYHLFSAKEHSPTLVGRGNIYNIYNIRQWIINNQKPFKLLSEKCNSATEYLQFECIVCHEIFNRTWNNIKNGCGCRKCRYENQRKLQKRPRKGKTLLEYQQIIKDFDYDDNQFLPDDYSFRSGRMVKWKCNVCGYKWTTSVAHRTKDNSGCPVCANKMSKAEKEIITILNNNHINFIQEKCFLDCKDERVLPFDFYLPDYNIVIEYDGEQHFNPIPFHKMSEEQAKYQLKTTQKHDEIKNEYCKKNNIDIIRIPYWEKKDIKSYINCNSSLNLF